MSLDFRTRAILGTLFQDAWHGPAHDEKRHSASAVAWMNFIYDDPTDTSPYTPEEVRSDVGYVRLGIEELNNGPSKLSSGTGSGGQTEAQEVAVLDVQFQLYVPAHGRQAELRHGYANALRAAFTGLYVQDDGPPWLELRHMPGDTSHRDQDGIDDDPWIYSTLHFRMERRTTVHPVGLKEVTP